MIHGLFNEVSIVLGYLGEMVGNGKDVALGCSLLVDPIEKKFGILLYLTEIWYI